MKLKNRIGLLFVGVIITITLFTTGCTMTSSKSLNKEITEDIIKESSEDSSDINLDDMIMLPVGVDNRKQLEYNVILENLYNDTLDEEPLNVEEYVDIIHIVLFELDNLKTFNKIKVTKELDETKFPNSKYKDLYDLGYLELFSEEDIENNVIISMNSFTRAVSSILGTYKPYIEVSEEDMWVILSPYEEHIPKDSPKCRTMKTVHLIQNNLLPVSYNGDLLYDKPLNKTDMMNMLMGLKDTIQFIEADEDVEGCLPCWEEEVISERRSKEE